MCIIIHVHVHASAMYYTPIYMYVHVHVPLQDFKGADGQFDISKIPDIYDCIQYDLLHNRYLHVQCMYTILCLEIGLM